MKTVYKKCKCGLSIYNKAKVICLACQEEDNFNRLAREIGIPMHSKDRQQLSNGYRRTVNRFID